MSEIVEMFSPEEKERARKTKKILLISWFVVLAVYVALLGTLIGVNIYRVNVFRDRSTQVWMTALAIFSTVLFVCYTMFFFSIKFRLTRKYVRMLRDMETGLKDEAYVTFLKYDETVSMKDGVYFYTMVVDAKPLKREDITERRVLVEHTIEKPPLEEGQKLKITTHANILMSYKPIEDK